MEYWNYKTAHDAYDAGDFELAADIYKRLAHKGDARAQTDLGFLYSVGQGVPQDFTTAVRWFRMATRQGHAPAMLLLAGFYASGHGVQRSSIEAYKFYSLASVLGQNAEQVRLASSRRDALAIGMTADQLNTARNRVCRWWRNHMGQERGGDRPPVPAQICAAG